MEPNFVAASTVDMNFYACKLERKDILLYKSTVDFN